MTFDIAGAKASRVDPEAVVRTAAEWGSSRGAEVCLLDARSVFGRDHLESAVLHAIRAREERKMSSRSVAMEALLYAAGARQVQDAIQSVGLRQDTTAIGVVLFGSPRVDDFIHDMGWSRDDRVLNADGKSLERLGISDREAKTVSDRQQADLILEKVALLDVESEAMAKAESNQSPGRTIGTLTVPRAHREQTEEPHMPKASARNRV